MSENPTTTPEPQVRKEVLWGLAAAVAVGILVAAYRERKSVEEANPLGPEATDSDDD